jgi:hypothetical protein
MRVLTKRKVMGKWQDRLGKSTELWHDPKGFNNGGIIGAKVNTLGKRYGKCVKFGSMGGEAKNFNISLGKVES